MTFAESIRIAVASLLPNKLHAILTMLRIIIGVGAVITLMPAGREDLPFAATARSARCLTTG